MYYAFDSENSNEEYVIKIIDLTELSEKESQSTIRYLKQELSLLEKINSNYSIKHYSYAAEPDNTRHYLLQEYCNCDLQKLLNQRGYFVEEEIALVLGAILLA